MGRVQWLAKWYLERESSSAFSWDEVAAGSYRHIHINSRRVYRGRGPQSSQTTTYTRSTFELPCGELLVEGVLLLWRLPSLVILMAGLGELEPPTSPLSGAFM